MKLFTDKNYPIIVSCAKELSRWTEIELRDMGYKIVETTDNTVVVRGDFDDVMRLNLYLRTAHRVLVPLLRAECRNIRDLYQLAKSIDWENQPDAPRYAPAFALHPGCDRGPDPRKGPASARFRQPELRRGGVRVLGRR